MKRLLALMLALILTLSFGASLTALAEDTPVLSIAVESNVFVEDYATNEFTLMLEKALGVKLDVQVWSEPKTKLSLLVGSNAELPDIIGFTLDDTTIYKYGSTGVFQPLNEYFANADVAKNFLALPQDKQDIILNNSKCADGNNYSMPLLGEYFPNNVSYNLLINKVWLDQLGLAIPTTTEEFRTVLEAFAANDMNGNGKKDEIALLSCNGGPGSNVAATLLNSFVNANPTKNFFYVQNGEIKASFLEDAFREGLVYIRGLVQDGLLDPASFTQTKDQMKAIANQDVAVVGVYNMLDHDQAFNKPANPPTGYTTLNDHPIASQYVYMKVPTGPEGYRNTIYSPTTPTQLFFITKDCENPELAFRLGDLGYIPYNSLISRHGAEGENWTADPEVLKNFKAATIDGVTLEAKWVLLDDPWGRAQNKHWYQKFPGYFSFDFNLYRGQTLDAKPSKMEVVYSMFSSDVPEEYIGKLAYTAEEIDELAFIQTAVDSYVNECITAFVTGNMDTEKDWDRYVNELKNMDVARYTEIMQAAYDRANK